MVLATNLHPALHQPRTQPQALRRRGCANTKDNSQPKSPPEQTQALTQILVLNEDTESWVAAKQTNTSPLPTKPSFCSKFLSSSDTGVWERQVVTIPTAKSGPPGRSPKMKETTEEGPYFQPPRGFTLATQILAELSNSSARKQLPQSPRVLTRILLLRVSTAPAGCDCHQLPHQLASHPMWESQPWKHRDGNKRASGFQDTTPNCLVVAYVLTPLHPNSQLEM